MRGHEVKAPKLKHISEKCLNVSMHGLFRHSSVVAQAVHTSLSVFVTNPAESKGKTVFIISVQTRALLTSS
jgi:hypothetical protein